MLQATNLVLQRHGRRLNKPSFLTATAGELVWLRGDNGVGKSTLLKMLLGMIKPSTGDVQWQNPKPQIFYLAHELAIKPQLTAAEQCRWHPAVSKTSDEVIDIALSTVRLKKQKHLPCSQLSRGQQQRLALACALLSKARLWLLDEPFTALDQESQKIIKQVLQAHQQSGGAAVIASHNCLADIASHSILLEAA